MRLKVILYIFHAKYTLRNLQRIDTERKILVNFWYHTFLLPFLLLILLFLFSLSHFFFCVCACRVVDVSTCTSDLCVKVRGNVKDESILSFLPGVDYRALERKGLYHTELSPWFILSSQWCSVFFSLRSKFGGNTI